MKIGNCVYSVSGIPEGIAQTEEGETTVLSGATTKSKSLRVTVPIGIVRQFGAEGGRRISLEAGVRERGTCYSRQTDKTHQEVTTAVWYKLCP